MSDAPPTLLLTVRDAAERLGVTPRTLKYYEERGLVTPSRSEGRYRLYDAADLERFARILRLRALGFSLHGITEMLKRPLEPAGDGRRRYSTHRCATFTRICRSRSRRSTRASPPRSAN